MPRPTKFKLPTKAQLKAMPIGEVQELYKSLGVLQKEIEDIAGGFNLKPQPSYQPQQASSYQDLYPASRTTPVVKNSDIDVVEPFTTPVTLPDDSISYEAEFKAELGSTPFSDLDEYLGEDMRAQLPS